MISKNYKLVSLLILLLLINGCTYIGQIVKEDKKESLSLDVKTPKQSFLGKEFVAEIELTRSGKIRK